MAKSVASSDRDPKPPAPAEQGAVAELQGVYGPFGFPEKLLQRLWLNREFDERGARLQDGRTLDVLHPGRWNHLGGPDFQNARLRIEGQSVHGDVEVHLHEKDWDAHGHAIDPAYDGVALHVVLFPTDRTATKGVGGATIPILVLLPRLWHDLEAYAADEAIAALANQPTRRLFAELSVRPEPELNELVRTHAARRWDQKVRHAVRRIEKLGWAGACHHAALEVLGYRFNRAPMLRVAGALEAEGWRTATDAWLEEAWRLGEPWSLHGVRPANAPRHRLTQFATWNRVRPDWIAALENWAAELAAIEWAPGEGIAAARRVTKLSRRRANWCDGITGGVLSGGRFDHLIGDGLLPLAVASSRLSTEQGWAWWWMGYPGDLPDAVQQGLRDLGLGGVRGQPLATGPAQGLLDWMWTRDEGR